MHTYLCNQTQMLKAAPEPNWRTAGLILNVTKSTEGTTGPQYPPDVWTTANFDDLWQVMLGALKEQLTPAPCSTFSQRLSPLWQSWWECMSVLPLLQCKGSVSIHYWKWADLTLPAGADTFLCPLLGRGRRERPGSRPQAQEGADTHQWLGPFRGWGKRLSRWHQVALSSKESNTNRGKHCPRQPARFLSSKEAKVHLQRFSETQRQDPLSASDMTTQIIKELL